MIVYDGQLCLSIKIDSGTEMPLAYVSRGAILNSTNFLVPSTQNVSAQCLTSVTYYFLPYRTLTTLAGVYPELRANLQKAKKAAHINQMLDLKKLDMQEAHYDVSQKIQLPAGLRLNDAQKRKVPHLKLLMKNAALHYLCQLRKSQKNKSLTSILEKLSQKAKRRKTEILQMRKDMQKMTLVQRLETISVDKSRIADANFDKLKKATTTLGKDFLIKYQRHLNKLKDIVENRFLPELDQLEIDSDFEFEERGMGR